MLSDKQIIEIKLRIDEAIAAFNSVEAAIADCFQDFGIGISECMAAQPEYIPNSSLKQIGGHYFGLWWYSDVSEVTVLPVDPIIRQYPVSRFVALPIEIIGVEVQPRPPPQRVSLEVRARTARLSAQERQPGFFVECLG